MKEDYRSEFILNLVYFIILCINYGFMVSDNSFMQTGILYIIPCAIETVRFLLKDKKEYKKEFIVAQVIVSIVSILYIIGNGILTYNKQTEILKQFSIVCLIFYPGDIALYLMYYGSKIWKK